MFGAEPKLKSLIKKEAREPSRCFLKSGVYIYKPFGCFRLPSAASYVKGRENFIHAYNRLKDSPDIFVAKCKNRGHPGF
ncbi:hypothetical protein D2962_11665 [Biomaibacter acetigenes]|jgi:hypothetical protein|uniref:Uncharacterized protein n=1 Tax=Biomaibacter acetigenes TaxID=2316383 RepID=A0A3G2R7X1_9FIRM|nr:hypothetical protein D2962_11665 [Biomaibacter acetigenes]RKL64102.1 hypothetical protein DXT63_03565 [Thermoanaerobacteraceae bacterium SP2]